MIKVLHSSLVHLWTSRLVSVAWPSKRRNAHAAQYSLYVRGGYVGDISRHEKWAPYVQRIFDVVYKPTCSIQMHLINWNLKLIDLAENADGSKSRLFSTTRSNKKSAVTARSFFQCSLFLSEPGRLQHFVKGEEGSFNHSVL